MKHRFDCHTIIFLLKLTHCNLKINKRSSNTVKLISLSPLTQVALTHEAGHLSRLTEPPRPHGVISTLGSHGKRIITKTL